MATLHAGSRGQSDARTAIKVRTPSRPDRVDKVQEMMDFLERNRARLNAVGRGELIFHIGPSDVKAKFTEAVDDLTEPIGPPLKPALPS